MNIYRYVGNNSANGTDPFGLCEDEDDDPLELTIGTGMSDPLPTLPEESLPEVPGIPPENPWYDDITATIFGGRGEPDMESGWDGRSLVRITSLVYHCRRLD